MFLADSWLSLWLVRFQDKIAALQDQGQWSRSYDGVAYMIGQRSLCGSPISPFSTFLSLGGTLILRFRSCMVKEFKMVSMDKLLQSWQCPKMSTFPFFDGAGCFFEISNGERHPKKFIRARTTYDWDDQLMKPFNNSPDRCKNSVLISLYNGLYDVCGTRPIPKAFWLPSRTMEWIREIFYTLVSEGVSISL